MPTPPTNLASLLLFQFSFWGPGPITFSIPKEGSQWTYSNESGASGYATLNSLQTARFITAIDAWDRLIAPNIVQTDDVTQPGQIRIAFTNYSEIQQSWGYAYTPPFQGGAGSARNGDIWINSNYRNSTFAANSYDYSAMLHEIGHTLGLTHPHDVPSWPSQWDSGEWTVMSYKDDYGRISRTFFLTAGGSLIPVSAGVYTSTPMVVDIAAVQLRYGADLTTATGNDTYTFSQTTPFMMSIYDAGGIDTIDVSNHTRGSIIDLRPGSYSSIGRFTVSDQIAAAVATYGANYTQQITSFLNQPETYTWTNNLGIAFTTVIENVRAGPGNDVIYGNAANNDIRAGGGDNEIHAGDGDDFILAGMGNDLIDGGYGNDSMILNYNFSEGGVIRYVIGYFMGGEGIDFIARVERFTFLDGVIDLNDADPMIDDLFYYGYNRDVWNAKVDADTHYKTTGWKEGRDPNDFFDTKGYMAAYGAEVLASGLDPLTHYLTIGWKKNYDPSKQFDTSQYLAFHTDVASAGINPLVHFLTNGQYEFRQYFNDGVFDRL